MLVIVFFWEFFFSPDEEISLSNACCSVCLFVSLCVQRRTGGLQYRGISEEELGEEVEQLLGRLHFWNFLL